MANQDNFIVNNTAPNNEKMRATWDNTQKAYIQHVNVDQLLMTAKGMLDWGGEVALGNIPGYKSVNKFGEAPSGIQTTETDIWDRADATPTQQVWVAPTQARVHAIVSSSPQDANGGNGAAYVVVYGLTDWNTEEVSEVVTLNGINPVNTVNSYVIIHRMRAIGQGSTIAPGVNVGAISATAAVDGTITAVILAANGQTEMAIYGVPSVQDALIYRWSAQIDRTSAAAATADFRLRVNENPNVQLFGFVRKDDISLQSTGSNAHERNYKVPIKVSGPCIIKVAAVGSANDIDGEAQFDLVLVTK